jgi:hypothetical protein
MAVMGICDPRKGQRIEWEERRLVLEEPLRDGQSVEEELHSINRRKTQGVWHHRTQGTQCLVPVAVIYYHLTTAAVSLKKNHSFITTLSWLGVLDGSAGWFWLSFSCDFSQMVSVAMAGAISKAPHSHGHMGWETPNSRCLEQLSIPKHSPLALWCLSTCSPPQSCSRPASKGVWSKKKVKKQLCHLWWPCLGSHRASPPAAFSSEVRFIFRDIGQKPQPSASLHFQEFSL